ncbi:MAG: class I SAM-dependent methyltransferase [Bacteroidota bacterium]
MSISESYNAWASIYDTNKNKTRDLDGQATRQTLAPYAFTHVLEAGCGTGKNTLWFAEKAVQVTALDFSEKMLAVAREKVSKTSVHFQQADLLQAWPVEDAAVDLVSFNLVLEHIEELTAVLAEAHRVLEPGGKLFICELHPFKQYVGSKARFETEEGVMELEVHLHHFTDYIKAAQANGFRLLDAAEWFDEEGETDLPRLLSFLFEK